MYYVNEFNKPSTDEWEYAIWKIREKRRRLVLSEYEFIKKIYDTTSRFKVGDIFDLTPSLAIKNERKVVQRIFEGK